MRVRFSLVVFVLARKFVKPRITQRSVARYEQSCDVNTISVPDNKGIVYRNCKVFTTCRIVGVALILITMSYKLQGSVLQHRRVLKLNFSFGVFMERSSAGKSGGLINHVSGVRVPPFRRMCSMGGRVRLHTQNKPAKIRG